MGEFKTSPLYQLIRSMTSSEKRYFKLATSVFKTNTNLLTLFEILDAQKVYDEKAVQKKLNSKGVTGSWPLLQNRLQQLIMKTLRQFHANTNVENQLHNMLVEIEVLYKKRLYDICRKSIRKARKLAQKHENQLVLLKLLKWDTVLQKEKGKHLRSDLLELEEMYEEERHMLKQYERSIDYKFHVFNFLLMSRNRMMPEVNAEMNKYDEILKTDLFAKPDEDLTIDEQSYLNSTLGMYYFNKGDMQKSRHHFGELARLLEESDRGLENLMNEYFMALNNLLIPQALVRDIDGFKSSIGKLYTHFSGEKDWDKDMFATTICYEFGIYHELGDFAKLDEMLPMVIEGLDRYDKILNPINQYIFFYNVALTFFYKKEHSQAIRWINRLLNDHAKRPVRATSNLYYFSHFLSLTVHYEMGHFELLEHQVPSTINLVNKIRELNDYERTILGFFGSAKNYNLTGKEEKKAFAAFYTALKKFDGRPEQKGVLRFFNFEVWLESKQDGTPMYEIIASGAVPSSHEG